jgi:hypothetical protein
VSPGSKKASGRSPRRKAGRVAAKPKRELTFTLTVDAQEMLVKYKPDHFRSEFAFGQFEFRSPRKPSRGIPVSRTGYYCHFAPMAEVKRAKSLQAFAQEIVETILGRSKGASAAQLWLF